jgi:hypothetical protein
VRARTISGTIATTWQAILTVPALLWLYGWQSVDLVEWRTLTAAPFSLALEPSRQFLYSSPLTYLAGAYYQRQGLGFVESFWLVHGLGLVLLAYALSRFLTERCGADYRGAGMLILAGSPLLVTLVSWIGKDDSFLVAFYLLLLLSHSVLTRAALCVLMVACHRELSIAILVADMLIRGRSITIAAGAVAGVALSFLYSNVLLDHAPLTRTDYLIDHARSLLAKGTTNPLAHFVAALGPFWLYVLRPTSLTAGRIVVLTVAALLASVTLDFTRIFVLAATPLLLQLTVELVDELRSRERVALIGLRWPAAVLGLLAFAQVQLAGDRLTWIRSVSWTIQP